MVPFAFDINSCFVLVKGINGQSSTEENFLVFFLSAHVRVAKIPTGQINARKICK